MSIEWDEGLAKRLEGFAALKDNEFYCDKPEVVFAGLLLAEHTARLEAEAERDAERSLREDYQIRLAFRSGDVAHLKAERDALAEKVRQAERLCWGCDSPLWKCYEARKGGFVACCPECRHDAILSDQEGR